VRRVGPARYSQLAADDWRRGQRPAVLAL